VDPGEVIIWRNENVGATSINDPDSYTNVNIGTMSHGTPFSSSTAFLPNTVGEQILAFQGDNSDPRFIYALHTGSWGWLRPASDGISVKASSSTRLPPGLVEGVTAVSVQNLNNVVISTNITTINGTRDQVLAYIGESTNWVANDITVFPLDTWNFTFPDLGSAGGTITDYTILTGGWSITGTVVDVHSGLNPTGVVFDVLNPASNLVLQAAFTNAFATNANVEANLNSSVGAGSYALNDTGTFYVVITAQDSDNDRGNDSLSASLTVPFTVIDDDDTPPYFTSLTWNGKPDLDVSELNSVVITTRVGDVDSGIAFTSSPPHFVILNDTGSIIYSNAFTQPGGFSEGDASGSDTEQIWTPSMNLSAILSCGVFTCRVVIVDADNDRPFDGEVLNYEVLLNLVDGGDDPTELDEMKVNDIDVNLAVLTDEDIQLGGWDLAVVFTNASSVIGTNDALRPRYTLLSDAEVELQADVWQNYVIASGDFFATNVIAAVTNDNADLIDIGEYAIEWFAQSESPCDGGAAGTNLVQVVDDDDEAPLMHPLEINISSVHTLIHMGFDTFHGWTNAPQTVYGDYTNHVAIDEWSGVNYRVNTADSISSTRAAELQDNTSMLVLPARDNPGTLFAWARLGAGGADRELTFESTTNGTDWVASSAFTITSTNYQKLAWTIGHTNNTTLRIRRTGANGDTILVDDISLTKFVAWTNVSMIDITFDNAEDAKGVYQYRAITNGAPNLMGGTNWVEGIVLATNADTIAVSEGVITGFVFAVDNDNNRPNDRKRSSGVPYVLRIDREAPPAINNVTPVTDGTLDDSSEIRISWTAPASEAIAAGPRALDSEPLSPWRTYRFYYTESATAPSVTNEYIDVSAGYTSLGDYSITNVVLSNFVFGTEYRIAVAGVDAAGNIGPLSPPITNLFSGFSVTQGVVRANTQRRLYWTAAPNREYDMIYADGTEFSTALTNSWTRLASAVTNALADTNPIPAGQLRFYRGAPKDRWLAGNGRRVASEEVYVAADITLHPGRNWVALPGQPDYPEVLEVLGTALPPGNDAANATRVLWYDRSAHPIVVTNTLWLDANSGNPLWRTDPGNTPADEMALPVHQAFIVVLPGTSQETFRFLGKVPTNEQSQVLATGVGGPGALGSLNLVNFRIPRPMHPSEMGLTNIMQPGFAMIFADQMWKYDAENQVAGLPVWRRTDGTWMLGNTVLPTSNKYFKPTDGIVIRRRSGPTASNVVWTNSIPYPSPNRFLSP
jgi:hypothetical protein